MDMDHLPHRLWIDEQSLPAEPYRDTEASICQKQELMDMSMGLV